MNRRNIFTLAVPFFTAFVAAADGVAPLSLSEAMQIARSKDPHLKQSEIAVEDAAFQADAALAAHRPHLGLRADQFLAAKYSRLGVSFGGADVSFPSAYPATNINIEASLLLYDGFASWNKYRSAQLTGESSQLQLSYEAFKLEQEVRLKFYQALAAQELALVAQQNIKTLKEHLHFARASERSGAGTKYDVLRIDAQSEEANAEKLLADDNVVIARAALDQVLGTPTEKDRPLVGSLPPLRAALITDIKAPDLSQRTDVKVHAKHLAALAKDQTAAEALWLPKVTLFADEQFYQYRSFEPEVLADDHLKNAYAIGLRLSWDIYDGGLTSARAHMAENRVAAARETTETMLTNANFDFEKWRRRYLYNVALYDARQRNVEKSKESHRLALLALRAGARTHSEVLDAELDLFRASAGLVKAQVDAAEALIQLELAVAHRVEGDAY